MGSVLVGGGLRKHALSSRIEQDKAAYLVDGEPKR